MKNKKVILSSILSLVLCLSLIVGGTFALFTSESKTNIAITSGKVEVVATIENLAVHSPTAIAEDGRIVDDTNAAANGVFANGGTAEIVGSTLTLDKMTPGDKVTFDIRVKNNSTVAIKYRTLLLVGANDGLFEGLNVTVDGTAFTMTQQSPWKSMEVGAADIIIPVEVVLPSTAGNEYQEKSAELNFTVSAVQGNTVTEESEDGDIYLYNAVDLVAFSNSVNAGNTYEGKTVTLAANIDMAGIDYTPAGNVTSYPGISFGGTFDGNGNTISNLTVSDDLANHASAGLFGSILGTATIKDVTLVNATVSSMHYAGGIVGYANNAGATISGCTVKDSTISSRVELTASGYDNGDKVGGIIGLAQAGVTVTGNTVENTRVSAYRDFGGIAGCAQGTVSDNVITNLTLHQNLVNGYKTEVPTTVGEVVGRNDNDVAVVENNIVNGVTIYDTTTLIHDAAGLVWFSASVNSGNDYAGKSVLLMNDIDLTDVAWTAISSFAGTFDGQNYTVSNMTANLFGTVSGTVKNLNVDTVNVLNATKNGGNGFISAVAEGGMVANCTVSNVSIEWADTVTDTTDCYGGVISRVSAGAIVQNCKFSNIEMKAYGKMKRTGGVFAEVTGTISGCTIDGVTLIATDDKSGDAYLTQAGGIIADLYAGSVVSDCTISNVTVIADEAFNTGGIIGKAYVTGTAGPCEIALKTISVNGLTMEAGNTDMTYATVKNVGGFIGQMDSRNNDSHLTVDNCHINDLDMTLASAKKGEDPSAGFIASLNGGADITNCSVSGKIDGTNEYIGIGGFLGTVGGYDAGNDYVIKITDCSANVEITGNDNIFVGGFVAYAGSYNQTMTKNLALNFNNCEATDSFYGQLETSTTEVTTFTNCKVDGADFAG